MKKSELTKIIKEEINSVLKEFDADHDKKYDKHNVIFITGKSTWHNPDELFKNTVLHVLAYQKHIINTNYKFVKQEEKNGKLYLQFSIESFKKYDREELQQYFDKQKSSGDKIAVY